LRLSLISTGRRRAFDGTGGLLFTLGAAAFAIWVICTNLFVISDPLIQGILFVSGFLTLLFLAVGHAPGAPTRPTALDILLSALSFACGVFFSIRAERIQERIPFLDALTPAQFVAGSVLIILTIEATRRTTGLGLTAVVVAFLAYNWFGYLLPPPFGHGVSEFSFLLETLVFSTDGLFGVPILVVSSYVFLFVLFGTLLAKAGGGAFFFDLAAALTGKSYGGPAKVAVISSGLYGTVSGSPTSDVVTTGSITIPMMKRLGYPSRFAGAVEVAASTGGSAMPPILGSAAFILAEFTVTPYRDIVLATLIPALVFYVGVYAQVHFRAVKHGLCPVDSQIPHILETLRRGWVFGIPVASIIGMLWAGYSPVMTAGVGCLSVVLGTYLIPRTRLSLWDLIEALGETTTRILPVAAACAAAGLVIGGLSITGLGMKSAGLIIALSGGALGATLLLAAGVTILLGLGMPTPSAYILAAVLVAPALVDLGLPLLQSHIFLLYFAILSALTPPIAVAAMAASSIAEEDPFLIAFDAVRLAAIGFVLPFAFLWNPALLADGSPADIALALIGGIVAAGAVAFALEGRAGHRSVLLRAISLAGAIAAVAPQQAVALVGIAIVFCVSLLAVFPFRGRPDVKVLPLDHPMVDDHIKEAFGTSPILIQLPTVFALYAPATEAGAAILDECKQRRPGKYYSFIVGDPRRFFELAPDLLLSRFLLSSDQRLDEFTRDMEGAFLRLPIAAPDHDTKVICNGMVQALFVTGAMQDKMKLMERLTEKHDQTLLAGYVAPIGSSCNISGDPAGSITDFDRAFQFARDRGVRLILTTHASQEGGSGPIFAVEHGCIRTCREGPGTEEKARRLALWLERALADT